MIGKTVPRKRFSDAFKRLGWLLSKAKSGEYDIWTSPQDKDIWTVVPRQERSPKYKFYQSKNIKMLLFALGLPEKDQYYNEVSDQLLGYNYKLLSKVVNRHTYGHDQVPFELASTLSNKNVDAFRSFYRAKAKTDISIDKFALNHTQQGSFIIPVSIPLETSFPSFAHVPSKVNSILREYLNKIDSLIKVPRTSVKIYTDKMFEEEVSSRIVKDFLNQSNSIAGVKKKYEDKIKEITISSKGNPILDYNLSEEQRQFKEVDLGRIDVLPSRYIEDLEKREIETDPSTLKEHNVRIEVEVDSIHVEGRAQFQVFAIDRESLDKPFKATTTELTKLRTNLCADALKTRDMIIVTGDIQKSKGQMGKIIADNLELKPKERTLFDLSNESSSSSNN